MTRAGSYIHDPRLVGQGYCSIEDVVDEISTQRVEGLEEYEGRIQLGELLGDDDDELTPEAKRLAKKIRKWITRWSNYIDDRIRIKYKVPFPDYPYAPGVLETIAMYLVIHNIYVYNGLYRGAKDEDESSYYGMAERLLKQIVSGEIQLKTEWKLPLVDANGNVVGVENVTIGLTGNIIVQTYTENPMSMANQDKEFGYPVRSRFGGSGYRNEELMGERSGIGTGRNNRDYD